MDLRKGRPMKFAGWVVFSLLVAVRGSDAGQARLHWQAEWEKTVEAAEKEGQLTVYIGQSAVAIMEAGVFQRKYPKIKVMHVAILGGPSAQQRIFSERRAGKYLVDIYIYGGNNNIDLLRAKALDPIKPALILQEVLDETKWWQGKHPWVDPERQYIFMHMGSAQPFYFGYNAQLANPKEFTSLKDLLNPKWRGKIVAYDIRAGGPGGGGARLLYHHPKYGVEFLRDFYSKMDVTLSRETRQAIDWLAKGKFVICFLCGDRPLREAKEQGLPIDVFDSGKDVAALSSQAGTIGLMNRAPHPNAAKVFLNWLLSREGQIVAQRALAQHGSPSNSMRIDIPKDDVPKSEWRLEGVQLIDVMHPSRLDMRPIYKLIEDAMREGGRR